MLITFVLFANILPSQVFANEDIDYEYMMKNEKFVKSYYEHSVEISSYFAGKYTDNRDYVRENIDDILNRASNTWENIKTASDEFSQMSLGEKYKELTSMLVGGFMTIPTSLDVKGLWNKFFGDNSESEIDTQYFSEGTYLNNEVILLNGIVLQATTGSNVKHAYDYLYVTDSWSGNYKILSFCSQIPCYSDAEKLFKVWLTPDNPIFQKPQYWKDLSIVFEAAQYSVDIPNPSPVYLKVLSKENNEPKDIFITNAPPALTTINNYYQDETIDKSYLPETYKPNFTTYLICNDERIDLSIQGRQLVTFDGQSYDVPEGEIINVNGIDCTLNFDKPLVNYDENGDVQITDKTGQYNPEIEREEEIQCDGVLCWVSNIFKSIGDLAKSIGSLASTVTNLVTNLIDALFHLIVPENLDFITDLFDTLKTTFTEKFAITTDIQNLFKSIFTESSTNPLTDLSFTLPATDTELSFSVFAVVDDYVPMIKRIISALLALMTLMYVYRKITGSGGVMEK